jgi:hypothetical protein
MSPRRVLAREASCSQFDAKLESPSRVNPKFRRERRVQSLLPDIVKRRQQQQPEHTESRSRQSSVSRSIRESSVGSQQAPQQPRMTTLEVQTREVVKQTVIAALRLHSIPSTHEEYKSIINHTVAASMFSLRTKLRAGKTVGMGEIGGIVERLLEMFLNNE